MCGGELGTGLDRRRRLAGVRGGDRRIFVPFGLLRRGRSGLLLWGVFLSSGRFGGPRMFGFGVTRRRTGLLGGFAGGVGGLFEWSGMGMEWGGLGMEWEGMGMWRVLVGGRREKVCLVALGW